jgi:predicted XRE-type DNA-binding protein
MSNVSVFESSGNIFADLDFENPAEEQVKATLVRGIRAIIKRRRLTQIKAGELMGLQQPDVSAIVNGRTGKFSVDRLLGCLDKLDYKVDVVIRHKARYSKLEVTNTF